MKDELKSFVWTSYWCPEYQRIETCSGPCPYGSKHIELDPCPTCEGLGRINAYTELCLTDLELRKRNPRVPLHATVLRGDMCPSCNGYRALPLNSDSFPKKCEKSRMKNPKLLLAKTIVFFPVILCIAISAWIYIYLWTMIPWLFLVMHILFVLFMTVGAIYDWANDYIDKNNFYK